MNKFMAIEIPFALENLGACQAPQLVKGQVSAVNSVNQNNHLERVDLSH